MASMMSWIFPHSAPGNVEQFVEHFKKFTIEEIPMLFDHGTNLLIRGVMGVPQAAGSGPSGDAAARIRAIRSDPKHAYNVPTSPAHDAAVREMNSLYERLSLPESGLSDELDVAL